MSKGELGKPHYLSKDERARVVQLLAKELESCAEVVFAVIFGGFLEERAFRDVDVGVYVDRKEVKDMVASSAYADELSGRLTKRAELPVDVVVLNYAPLWLVRRALKGVVILDRDPVLRMALWLASIDNAYIARARA